MYSIPLSVLFQRSWKNYDKEQEEMFSVTYG
jgi:hypothetical protein